MGTVAAFRFRNLPLSSHPWAREAALVGACVAEQGDYVFWSFAKAVFSQQQAISLARPPTTELEKLATDTPGVDMNLFGQCRQAPRAKSVLLKDQNLASENEIVATPTLFVNAVRINGLPSANALIAAIQMQANYEVDQIEKISAKPN